MIRQATASDEPAVRDCARQAYARYVPLIGRAPAPMVADFAADIAAGDVYVAMGDDGLQGFVTFRAEGRFMHLDAVAVLPAAAGHGIGKALIEFCENTARSRSLDAVHLYTNAKMTANLSIYPHLGYTEVARRTEDGFNREYFQKKLAY